LINLTVTLHLTEYIERSSFVSCDNKVPRNNHIGHALQTEHSPMKRQLSVCRGWKYHFPFGTAILWTAS